MGHYIDKYGRSLGFGSVDPRAQLTSGVSARHAQQRQDRLGRIRQLRAEAQQNAVQAKSEYRMMNDSRAAFDAASRRAATARHTAEQEQQRARAHQARMERHRLAALRYLRNAARRQREAARLEALEQRESSRASSLATIAATRRRAQINA